MDLIITSYGVITRDFKLMGQVGFERVVLDEAQAIKTLPHAYQRQCARCLPATALH